MRSRFLKNITRLVVKVGTGVLTDSRKQPDLAQMEQLVGQIAAQRKAGREIILVSSGAVGAGMGALGFQTRPGESSAALAADWRYIFPSLSASFPSNRTRPVPSVPRFASCQPQLQPPSSRPTSWSWVAAWPE